MTTNPLVKNNGMIPSVFNDLFKPWNSWFDEISGGRVWGNILTMPAVNIVEDKNDFRISLGVPGLKKDDFNIEVEGNRLNVSAETKGEKEVKEEKVTRKEFNYSSFHRSFTLPDGIWYDKIEARYEDGVLNIFLPKTEEVKKVSAKQIAVK